MQGNKMWKLLVFAINYFATVYDYFIYPMLISYHTLLRTLSVL